MLLVMFLPFHSMNTGFEVCGDNNIAGDSRFAVMKSTLGKTPGPRPLMIALTQTDVNGGTREIYSVSDSVVVKSSSDTGKIYSYIRLSIIC